MQTMQDGQSWQCSYCGHRQVLQTGQNFKVLKSFEMIHVSERGNIGFKVFSIACLNLKCKKLTLKFSLWNTPYRSGYRSFISQIKLWPLLPDSIAKPQPEYIPPFIRIDYEEACKIMHFSPKASAVLSRRCLQSMIRDFCKIEENTLHAEIQKLQKEVRKNAISGVTEESIRAFDCIKTMGNIGAYMKLKANVLVDVEPKEAELLIKLIETLFKDWYIARYDRQQRLKKIKEAVANKKQQKQTTNKKVKEKAIS